MQENKKESPQNYFYISFVIILFISFLFINFNFYRLYKLQQETFKEVQDIKNSINETIALSKNVNAKNFNQEDIKLQDSLHKGESAPLFKLRTTDNKYYSLQQYLNLKNIILVAWIPTCPYCRAFLPQLEKFYRQHKNEYAILSVSRIAGNDDMPRLLRAVKELNLTLPVLLSEDKTDSFGYDYKLKAVPTMWLIDKNLQIIDVLQKNKLQKINLEETIKSSFKK